jgi:putative pyruvate formate lyase activating enzyme
MLAKLLKLTHQVDERFVIEEFEPAYLKLFRAGKIEERVTAGLRELEDCCACPRNCHINRLENEARVCHTGRYAKVGSAFAHFGEEDSLRAGTGRGRSFSRYVICGACALKSPFMRVLIKQEG